MPPERTASPPEAPPPFGIAPRHLQPHGPRRLRSLLVLLFIGLPLAAALLGLLGGGRERTASAASPAARLTVETPAILRSGNWFEMQVVAEPRADVADLTIAIDEPLWRHLSIDTMVPDAETSQAVGGRFAYAFGPVRKGERFVLKLDGQIQPRWFRRQAGRIALRDGERMLAEVPLVITVLP
jgi:hypothetical protein